MIKTIISNPKLYLGLIFKYLFIEMQIFKYIKIKFLGSYQIIDKTKHHIILKDINGILYYGPDIPELISGYDPNIEFHLYPEFDKCDGIFMDIGAYVGKYSLYLAKKGIKSISIEPNPKTYKILEKNIEANNLGKYIIPQQFALVNQYSTYKKISLVDNFSISTIIDSNTYIDHNIFQVEEKTFNDLLKDLNIAIKDIGLIKIDVEGLGISINKMTSGLFKKC